MASEAKLLPLADSPSHARRKENVLIDDKSIQGRYSMVREFSFSFARLWKEGKYDFGHL